MAEQSADSQQQLSASLTCPQICWRMVIWIVSLAIIVVNVAVDIITLILYFDSEERVFFSLTLTFLFLPTLVIAVASLIWLWDEHRRLDATSRVEDDQLTIVSVLLHVTLLGLVFRYGRLIMKAPLLREEQGRLVKSWERDAHLLMFLQTILHCCSQLTLQLYIIADDSEDSTYIPMTVTCVIVNSIAILWSLFVYTLYNMCRDSEIKPIGKLVIFVWHFCIIISRVLALAFFTVAFHAFVFIPYGIHWAVWSTALFFMSTEFCLNLAVTPHKKRLYLELPFDIVIGYVLIFFYFNAKKGRTWYIVVPYHVLTFVETVVLSVLFYTEKPNEWYSILILCLTILLFLIASALMLIYYIALHPKTRTYWVNHITNHPAEHRNGSTARMGTDRQSNDSL